MRLVLAACVAVAPCAQAQQASQPYTPSMFALMTIRPHRPVLAINEDPSLCEPLLKAWTRLFDSPEKLEEPAIDPAAVYPAATHMPGRPSDPETRHTFPDMMPYRADFDGDGDIEVLHFETDEIGWRYLGVNLWLFDSEADYETVSKARRVLAHRLSLEHADPVPGASYRQIFRYTQTDAIRLFQTGGRIYATTDTALVHLNAAGGKPKTVCNVQVLPPNEDHTAFLQSSPLLVAAADIYGGRTSVCLGTMGWTAPPYDASLPDMLHRPWAMKTPPEPATEKEILRWRRRDALRELVYMWWGASDPQSWRDYLEAKASRPQFIDELRAYYLANFTSSEAEASRLAEWAWRRMLDNLSYAGGDKGDGSWRNDAGLSITPETTPAEMGRLMVATLDASITKEPAYARQDVGATLIAAIYTRQPTETVRKLADRWYALVAEDIARVQPGWPDRPKVMKENYERMARGFLLGSLGHTGLTNLFLERGIDPGAGTNWFGKTPLMYAAQSGQLNAVRTLIARGVDVNAATKANGDCGQLQRDNRTALMYAAENAPAPVIEALVAAGADIAAKDTQGHTALWYFDRNSKAADVADRRRIIPLLGG